MKTVITHENGQKIVRSTHDGSSGFAYIDENNQVERSDKNPNARELVIYFVQGALEKEFPGRYVVAYFDTEKQLIRSPNSYGVRKDAEIACKALSGLFGNALVLDTNFSIPVRTKPKGYELDGEELDRYYEDNGLRKPGTSFQDAPPLEYVKF